MANCIAGNRIAVDGNHDVKCLCGRTWISRHRSSPRRDGDAPENTVYAISKALQNSADAVWITLQLSSDGVPVLYRPTDLKVLTSGSGPISALSAAQLARLDAAYYYNPKDGYPLRGKGYGIPSLEEVLKTFKDTFFYLDIKSPDADPNRMATALSQVLERTGALSRVRIYSTEAKYTAAVQAMPHFETRDETRTALANVTMNHTCQLSPKFGSWYGYELRRDVTLIEETTRSEPAVPISTGLES